MKSKESKRSKSRENGVRKTPFDSTREHAAQHCEWLAAGYIEQVIVYLREDPNRTVSQKALEKAQKLLRRAVADPTVTRDGLWHLYIESGKLLELAVK